MNLHVFPENWDRESQMIQYLAQSKQNIPIDDPRKENLQKNLFLVFCALCRVQFKNRANNYFDDRLFQSYMEELQYQKDPNKLYVE